MRLVRLSLLYIYYILRTIFEFEPERIINIIDKKIFKNVKKRSDSSSSSSSTGSDNSSKNEYAYNKKNNPMSIDDIDSIYNELNENSEVNVAGTNDNEDLLNNLSFKNGDVIWDLIDENDYMPFFECKTFQVRFDSS